MAFTKEVGGIEPWTSLYIYNFSLMIMQCGVLYVPDISRAGTGSQ